MRTHSGNVGRVQADIAKITLDTLDKFNIKYDEIYFGKPYAHFYIDDLAIKSYDDIEKETGFYNIHPETRTHNKIEIFDNYIIKYSEKIDGEKYYYKNIPENIKYLFPEMIDSGEDFIKISKIQGIPLSFLNINNTLTKKILLKLLDNIYHLHNNNLTSNENINIYSNYYDKLENRLNSYDFSQYKNFDIISTEILNFLKEYEFNNKGKIGIIHGDPVFTNILIDTKDNIKMIDMRGKIGDEFTIFGDIFYDYAKIYQSLIGYDHILMGKDFDIKNSIDNIEFFESYISEKFGKDKINDIKQITKSLILSLIPIHDDQKCLAYYNLIVKEYEVA
jgi:thiamine kinase-like enzyme